MKHNPQIKGSITRAIEALDQSEYALARAVCWKPPSANQRKIEDGSLKMARQALADLKAFKDALPDDPFTKDDKGYFDHKGVHDTAKLTAQAVSDE